jgi:hypothetical protein
VTNWLTNKAARHAILIPGALAASALATHVLLRSAPAFAAAGLAQPVAVATNWNVFGALLLGVLCIGVAIAGLAYLRLLVRLRDATGNVSIGTVVSIAAIALACTWFAPVLFSSDVYAYAAYGEMLRLGIDPYAHALLPAGHAILQAAIFQWGNPPPACVYGPAFVAVASAAVATLAPLGTVAQLDGLRVLACVALVACALGAYHAYPGKRRDRIIASATIGLNPVAIWCAVEGHNDALALAVVLAGFALVQRGAANAGAFVVALAGSIKAPGLVAALPLIAASPRARWGAVAGIALVALLSYPLFVALTAHVAPGGHYAPQASMQAVFGAYPPLAISAALAACAILARSGIIRLRRRDASGWVFFALAAWVLVPNPYPWYGIWLIAVAALAPGTRVATAALLLSLTSLLRYVPDAVATPSEPVAILLGLLAIAPLAFAR